MNNIRLFIIGISLMLCVWLGASFIDQTQPTAAPDSSATSVKVLPLSSTETEDKNQKEPSNQLAEPIARIK